MTHIHQAVTLYGRANPENIQPGVVQPDLLYKNFGHVKGFLTDARKLDPDSSVGVHHQLFQCLTSLVWCRTQHLLLQL